MAQPEQMIKWRETKVFIQYKDIYIYIFFFSILLKQQENGLNTNRAKGGWPK
jgi:hypothetical protein